MERREEDKLVVALNQRQDAISHSATYIRGSFFTGESNGFYAPIAGEVENGQGDMVRYVSQSDREYLLMEYGSKEVAEEKKRAALWDKALQSRDTINIVTAIRDMGIPKSELQRVEMLHVLRNPGKGLRISYDALCDFSESFREAYNFERIKELICKHIVGGSDYLLTLENSLATKEEKEIILFVFPKM